MNVYVCDGERLVVSEPPLDQDDQPCVRMTLESCGRAVVSVGDRFKENQKSALICVQRDGRVYVVVQENDVSCKSYDLDAINGVIHNVWEARK